MRNNSKNLVTKKDVLFNSFEKHNTNVCVRTRFLNLGTIDILDWIIHFFERGLYFYV